MMLGVSQCLGKSLSLRASRLREWRIRHCQPIFNGDGKETLFAELGSAPARLRHGLIAQ